MSDTNGAAAAAAAVESKTADAVPESNSNENGAVKTEDRDTKPEPRRDERRSYNSHKKDSHIERRNKYMDSSRNVRTDYAALPETDDPDEIRKQVEFYFSDSNLYYDDHMRQRVLGNKEDTYGENHGVPVKEIHSFKRMKRFQPYSAVVAALMDSKTLQVLSDKEDLVQRKTALPKPSADQDGEFGGDPTIPRAIYAKGFGDETKTTQFDVEAFFTPYGPLNSVRLRRTFPDRIFKGSVFVEFENEELQKQFLEMDPKPKYDGKELLIKSKRQYCDEKLVDVKNGKVQSNKRSLNFKNYYQGNNNANNSHNHNHNNNRSNRGGGRGHRGGGRGHRGGRDGRDGRDRDSKRDRNDWRGRRDDFQAGRKDKDEQGGSGGDKSAHAGEEANADTQASVAETQTQTQTQTNDEGVNVSKKRARDETEADADADASAGAGETKKVKADADADASSAVVQGEAS